MANTPKQLYVGKPGTTSATVYTVPAATTTIVKNITMVNTTASAATVTVTANGFDIVSGATINPKDTVSLDLSLVLPAAQVIATFQGTASAINVLISGVEVA